MCLICRILVNIKYIASLYDKSNIQHVRYQNKLLLYVDFKNKPPNVQDLVAIYSSVNTLIHLIHCNNKIII